MGPLDCNQKIYDDGTLIETVCAFALEAKNNATLNKCTQVPHDLLKIFKSALESCSIPMQIAPVEETQSCPNEIDVLAICKKAAADEQTIFTSNKHFYDKYCPGIADKIPGCSTFKEWNVNQLTNDFIIPAVVIIAVFVIICTGYDLYKKRVEYNKRPERQRFFRKEDSYTRLPGKDKKNPAQLESGNPESANGDVDSAKINQCEM